MYFGDPVAAFTNIARALRPGGRLTLFVWQSLPQNHWVSEFSQALAAGRELPTPPPDAPGPFSLADPDGVREILAAARFSDIAFDGVSDLMYFGRDAEEGYRFIRGQGFTDYMLRGLDEDDRIRALDASELPWSPTRPPKGSCTSRRRGSWAAGGHEEVAASPR